jgi:Fe-Mn family superoxide dismutase
MNNIFTQLLELNPESMQEKLLDRREFLKATAMTAGTALALTTLPALALEAKPCQPESAQPCPHCGSKVTGKNGTCAKCQATHTHPHTTSHKPCPHCGTKGNCAHCQAKKQACATSAAEHYNQAATIEVKTFPNLSTVEGISQNQLDQHIGLYQGYVKKINEMTAKISSLNPDAAAMNGTYSEFRELHVEQSFALNGAVLHEYYFENIGGEKTPPTDMIKTLFAKEFGSWDNYMNHLTALGKSARGWVITGFNMRDKRIHNYLLDGHNQLSPVHVMPLLVLDVYEHAYMIDFGAKRAPYLEAFVKNIDWSIVEDRLKMMMLHGKGHR